MTCTRYDVKRRMSKKEVDGKEGGGRKKGDSPNE